MAQINSGMSNTFKFKIAVEGGGPITKVQLSIFLNDKTRIVYPGTFEDSTATFNIDDFEKFGKGGVKYPFELEIFMDNMYFVPLQDHFELISPTVVKADMISSVKETVTPAVSAEMLSEIIKSVEVKQPEEKKEKGRKLKKSKFGDSRLDIVSLDEVWISRRKDR